MRHIVLATTDAARRVFMVNFFFALCSCLNTHLVRAEKNIPPLVCRDDTAIRNSVSVLLAENFATEIEMCIYLPSQVSWSLNSAVFIATG